MAIFGEEELVEEIIGDLIEEYQEEERDNSRETSDQSGQGPGDGGGGGGPGVIVAEHDHHDLGTGGARVTPSTLNNVAIGQYVTLSGTQTLTNKTITAPTLNSYADFSEIAVPATAPANTLRLFVEDFKGFTFFSFIDSTGMVRKIVRDSVFVGKNVTGTAIPAMSPVYASGSSGNVPTLALAKADSATTMPCIGITVEAIADQAHGRVMQVGLLENVNTNAFTEGNVLYVSAATAGALTATVPVYPNIVQEVGTVLVKSVGGGAIQCIARSMVKDGYLGAGAAFPTSPTPVAGDRFFRTDLGWLCNYDGTRWLTAHTYPITIPVQVFTIAGTSGYTRLVVGDPAGGNRTPYFLARAVTTNVATTNDGSNYWTVTIQTSTGTFASASTLTSFTTAADTAGANTGHGAVINAAAGQTGTVQINAAITAGAPGALTIYVSLDYKLIVT